MVGALLMRGLFAGLVAGLLAFGFAEFAGEPQVNQAVAFETRAAAARGDAPEPALVSREVQRGLGLFTGVVVYGTAIGGLFALAFAFLYGRVGHFGARETAVLLAAVGLFAVVLVPQLKYPSNPPSVGNPATIGVRTEFYFMMLLISMLAAALAAVLRQWLAPLHGGWNAALMAVSVFLAIIVTADLVLPDFDEVPTGFPAELLWRFRIASLAMHVILWSALGLVFGTLAQRRLSASDKAIA